jgi:hypothetical protein
MWPTRNDPLDSAIDEVARELTEGQPARGVEFRRRVLARIEGGHAPRRRWRTVWMLSPIAVAAAIVIAVAVFTSSRSSSSKTGRPGTAPETPVAQAFGPAVAVTETPVVQAFPLPLANRGNDLRRGAPTRGTREGGRPAVRGSRPMRPSAIDALAPPAIDLTPLRIAPLDVVAVSPVGSIRVVELETIPPIAVPLLGTEDSQRRFP